MPAVLQRSGDTRSAPPLTCRFVDSLYLDVAAAPRCAHSQTPLSEDCRHLHAEESDVRRPPLLPLPPDPSSYPLDAPCEQQEHRRRDNHTNPRIGACCATLCVRLELAVRMIPGCEHETGREDGRRYRQHDEPVDSPPLHNATVPRD